MAFEPASRGHDDMRGTWRRTEAAADQRILPLGTGWDGDGQRLVEAAPGVRGGALLRDAGRNRSAVAPAPTQLERESSSPPDDRRTREPSSSPSRRSRMRSSGVSFHSDS